jgi:ABC-type transporter lipoprotein component MlaA
MIERVALDPYQFVRDAYLQQREVKVLDGESPP